MKTLPIFSLFVERLSATTWSMKDTITALNRARRIFPPLKKLLFEAFWFVFAAVEIVRFLRSLL